MEAANHASGEERSPARETIFGQRITANTRELPSAIAVLVCRGHGVSKTTQLRQLLTSKRLEFLMEAHNALSGRVVQDAGFKGIWASGLTISAQFGVRDNNEASWTQVLEVVEFMSDATSIPILVDGDTGYGNFNNVRRLVRKLEQRGVAGVCLEDKVFPKTNSFISAEKQPLAEVREFCGRIKAGKDTQSDRDFSIVARVEALITGWGMREALDRAAAYEEAGADAILIHSKRTDGDEIVEFSEKWSGKAPLVIVPTKYYSTPTSTFHRSGISLVIWANHILRASLAAMQETAAQIFQDETVAHVEKAIAPLAEVFRLQSAEELAEAERKYCIDAARRTRAILLAASPREEQDRRGPKPLNCMVPVEGRPILERLVETFRHASVKDVHVVLGPEAGIERLSGVTLVSVLKHPPMSELALLGCALDRLADVTLLCRGDILVRRYVLSELLERAAPIVIVVDSSSPGRADSGDRVLCSTRDSRGVLPGDVRLKNFVTSRDLPSHGEWIGLVKVSGEAKAWVRKAYAHLTSREDTRQPAVRDLLKEIVDAGHPVQVMYIAGHWMRAKRPIEEERAQSFLSQR